MHNYRNPSESRIEEFLPLEAGAVVAKNPETLRAEMALPDGHIEALRFGRRGNGKLDVVAPRLLSDMFGM